MLAFFSLKISEAEIIMVSVRKKFAMVLGHKRIENTEKYYISSTIENKKQVTEMLEKIIYFDTLKCYD